MTQHAINRREFVAISAVTAATAAISAPSLASTTSASTSSRSSRRLRIPAPTLARIVINPDKPTSARLQPSSILFATASTTLAAPHITISPLACIENRLATDAAITIEAHHPIPNIYTNLLQAHNSSIPGQSIPDFASTISTRAPRNSLGRTTLRITQRIENTTKSTLITLNTTAPGTYLLAVPTASRSANAAWRFTSATLDHEGTISKLNNPLPAASSQCAYFSIAIIELTPSELPQSNLEDIRAGE